MYTSEVLQIVSIFFGKDDDCLFFNSGILSDLYFFIQQTFRHTLFINSHTAVVQFQINLISLI